MNNLKYYKFVVELSENSFKILYIMIRIIYIKFLSYFDNEYNALDVESNPISIMTSLFL